MANDKSPDQPNQVAITGSRQLTSWMADQKVSLLFTTYQTGKLFLIGLAPDGRLSIFERTFNRCMGMTVHDDALYISTLYQLWRFENFLRPGETHEGYDRLFVPISAHTTGDLDIHDVAVDVDGSVLFVNTLFGCLATIHPKYSFVPLWKPPFITTLAAEDRCHLNGLALENGKPRYLTAVSQTNVADSWRDRRSDGGVVMDMWEKGEPIVTTGLSMPHSPRVYRDNLWILNSGMGYFGYVDRQQKLLKQVTFCPGYLRGMAFVGDYAVVGLSRPRQNKTFSGLPLDDNLKKNKSEARCGLQVININRGEVVHWLQIEGIVEELYDVSILPNVVRPMVLGFKNTQIRKILNVGPQSTLAGVKQGILGKTLTS